jgi:SAM-dependent methyltransferase
MAAGFSRWRAWWDDIHDEQTRALEEIPPRRLSLAIFAASALTLYVELVLVRWHATCFHAFAIFKNVSLLSCFLGLGIGYALSGRSRSTLATFLPLLALQTLLFGVLSATQLGGHRFNPVAEQLVMGTQSSRWSWLDAIEGNAFLAAVFVLNALMFIPLGHLAGRLMGRLPRVQAYSLNLLGSLFGIGLFSVLSLLWTPPAVWLGVGVLGVAPFLLGHRRLAAVGVGSMSVILIAAGLMERPGEKNYYSPYQVITMRLPEGKPGQSVAPMLKVNHCFYQQIHDCSGRGPKDDETERVTAYYDQPYQLCARAAGDVLVVGAGSGNDVAAALRNGANSVMAVEIDPTILYLGKRLHPERPYQDERTQMVLNDARTYLRQTDKRFDLVVYGLLDSHTNLGSMTNVRLDSFVYTVEGFRDAVKRLKDDGLLFVSYVVLDPRQGDKLFAMLKAAYPDGTPRVLVGSGGTHYVTGPGLARVPAHVAGLRDLTDEFLARGAETAEVATDDWPFFYMQKRTYPVTYAAMIALLLGLSAWMVRRQLGTLSLGGGARSGAFFFLGAGFMLIETKSITELGLVFGNTWQVISVVIGGILVMVYLANGWVARRGSVPHRTAFALLGAALLLGWGLNRLSMAGVVIPAARLVLPVFLTLPLFFAGLIFSSELKRGGEIGAALSANLFGAMLGGFLEYNSMYWGFSSLYPLGLGLYALAWLCTERTRRAEEAAPEAGEDAPLQQAA